LVEILKDIVFILETAFKEMENLRKAWKKFSLCLKNQTNLLMEVCIGFVYSASQNTVLQENWKMSQLWGIRTPIQIWIL
jgi:hypothetical protein